MDQLRDTNKADLFRIKEQIGLPDYVVSFLQEKQAAPEELTAYADPINRMFPIESKASTWLSNAFFNSNFKTIGNKKAIGEMLEKAATLWKLSDSDMSGLESLRMEEKTASGDLSEEEGVDICYDDSSIVRAYDRDDLHKIASDLMSSPEKYSYPVRQRVAEGLLDAEKILGVSFTSGDRAALQKTACCGFSRKDSVLSMLNMRTNRHPASAEAVGKVIEKVASEESDMLGGDLLYRAIGIADAVDRLTGDHTRYAQKYASPERTVDMFVPEHMSTARKSAVPLRNGKIVDRARVLEKSAALSEFFSDVLCEKVASESDLVSKVVSADRSILDAVIHILEA